jgi:hypothetical protein
MHELFEDRPVGELAFNEFGLGWDHRAVTVGEIVVDNDLMTLVEQKLSDGAADVTGAASNEYPQNLSPLIDHCKRSGIKGGAGLATAGDERPSNKIKWRGKTMRREN